MRNHAPKNFLIFSYHTNTNHSLKLKIFNREFSSSMACNLHFCKNNQKSSKVVVVIVPFLAQGHLNQLLQLSCLIASYKNIKVHYVSTKTHNLQAKLRVINEFDSISKIHFHEFSTPSFLSPNPNPNSRIKFPSHLQPSFEVSSYLRNPVKRLIQALSSKYQRVVIINDSLMGSVVQDYVSVPNAEAYTFHSVSAFTLFLFICERKQKLFPIDPEMLKDLPSLEGCFSPEFERFMKREYDCMKFYSGKIYNTCRVIESPFLDLLSKELTNNNNNKQWALGPFNPVTFPRKGTATRGPSHKCLSWLDKQEPNSVLYVSFGTTTSFSDEQIMAMAIGLEQSQQKFVWVLRGADKGNVFGKDTSRKIELPKGFEERVKERGILVRDWAPQLEILSHCSTGGFLSHCGWNSCMESISMGVPIAAWPMHSDQPRNTVLITKILKIGLVVRDWAHRDELVTSSMVQKCVEKLMASKEGNEMRNKARKLSAEIRKEIAEGGIKRIELDSFISHITRY
ncbi:zeatin O-glucosyltransferase [Capsicum annuum]|uniref:zeatin O-glucosyltransferase n=1 Tax=Capsicum annuum TaxID=4072 RepID=UPI001FB12B73|nr:zeatin O-glucosyltransferase [Capsicum annuum]